MDELNSKLPVSPYGTAFTGDCDDLTDPGFVQYVIDSSATNGPGGYYYMLVLAYLRSNSGGNTITQVCFGYNTARIAIRYRFNGSWSSWNVIS